MSRPVGPARPPFPVVCLGVFLHAKNPSPPQKDKGAGAGPLSGAAGAGLPTPRRAGGGAAPAARARQNGGRETRAGARFGRALFTPRPDPNTPFDKGAPSARKTPPPPRGPPLPPPHLPPACAGAALGGHLPPSPPLRRAPRLPLYFGFRPPPPPLPSPLPPRTPHCAPPPTRAQGHWPPHARFPRPKAPSVRGAGLPPVFPPIDAPQTTPRAPAPLSAHPWTHRFGDALSMTVSARPPLGGSHLRPGARRGAPPHTRPNWSPQPPPPMRRADGPIATPHPALPPTAPQRSPQAARAGAPSYSAHTFRSGHLFTHTPYGFRLPPPLPPRTPPRRPPTGGNQAKPFGTRAQDTIGGLYASGRALPLASAPPRRLPPPHTASNHQRVAPARGQPTAPHHATQHTPPHGSQGHSHSSPAQGSTYTSTESAVVLGVKVTDFHRPHHPALARGTRPRHCT